MDNYSFFPAFEWLLDIVDFLWFVGLCFDLFKCLGVILFCVVVVYCRGCGFMKVIRLKVPEDVSEVEVKLLVAVELYREGRLTLKQAADLAEMSVWDFYMIGKRKVSFTNIGVEDLREELEEFEG